MKTTNIATRESDIKVYFGKATDDSPRELAYTSVKYLYSDLTDIRRYYIRLGFHLEEFSRCEYYKDFGFSSLEDFCDINLGLDKGAVSRCINVYRTFNASVSPSYVNGIEIKGSSMELSNKWEEYSYSQLCEMLPLTPEQRKNVTPDMSVKQIREYKKSLKNNKNDDPFNYLKKIIGQVATSQPEEFDYVKYNDLKGAARKNYINKFKGDMISLHIYNSDGKEILVKLAEVIKVDSFSTGPECYHIRLYNNTDIEINEE